MTEASKSTGSLFELSKKLKNRTAVWGVPVIYEKDSVLAKLIQKPVVADDLFCVEPIKGDRYLTIQRGKQRRPSAKGNEFELNFNVFKEPNK